MTPSQFIRRRSACNIIQHILIHGYMENTATRGDALAIAAVLERAGVLKMHANCIDFVIDDLAKARHLMNG